MILFIVTQILKMKKFSLLVRIWNNWKPPALLRESLAVSIKLVKQLSSDPAIPLTGITQDTWKYMFEKTYSTKFIPTLFKMHNNTNTNRKRDKLIMVYAHNGILLSMKGNDL